MDAFDLHDRRLVHQLVDSPCRGTREKILLMTTVLRMCRHLGIIEKEFPLLHGFQKRCEARPAFQKALKRQMEIFEKNSPPKK